MSKKPTDQFLCEQCGEVFTKWWGKCPSCGTFNSLVAYNEPAISKTGSTKGIAAPLFSPSEARERSESFPRYTTGNTEIDRVLGGGFVSGSFVLLGGDPGIGKSTMMLHLADALGTSLRVLLFSGEESVSQIAHRAERLGITGNHFQIASENCLENILTTAEHAHAELIVIDSIQTLSAQSETGLPGSMSQIRLCSSLLMQYAKQKNCIVIVIGHVTKDGEIAGPKVLEHLVDAVLYLEGERDNPLRLLRTVKNRFGSTSEMGILTLDHTGLHASPDGGSFWDQNSPPRIGSCLSTLREGNRTLVIEVQTLTQKTAFGYPRRTASGLDMNRLNILLAVIERFGGVEMSTHDVYANSIGGIKMNDRGLDLALVRSVLSSCFGEPLPRDRIYIGEVGLS